MSLAPDGGSYRLPTYRSASMLRAMKLPALAFALVACSSSKPPASVPTPPAPTSSPSTPTSTAAQANDCPSVRERGIAAYRASSRNADQLAALEAIPHCAMQDESEYWRDQRLFALASAAHHYCKSAESSVEAIREHEPALSPDLESDPEIMYCMAYMVEERAERKRIDCEFERAEKLERWSTRPAAEREKLMVLLPVCGARTSLSP